MSFKDILISIDESKACAKRVEAAVRLAKEHGAHLIGLYVASEPVVAGYIRSQIPSSVLETQREYIRDQLASARAAFEKTAAAAGLSHEWRGDIAYSPDIPAIVGLHARYTDVVVLGQGDPEEDGEQITELTEETLLTSGRPGLVVPYIGVRGDLGRRIMISWDAGREAARAVSDALPLLKRADEVVVLVINPHKGDHGEQPGADLAMHLARHKIKVEAQHIESGSISIADALLSRISDEGIDLLVMGAYGHSRMRELVLGGVTRQIFENMTVPVFMSH